MNIDPSGEIFAAVLLIAKIVISLAVVSGVVRGITSGKGFFEGFGEGFINTFKIIGGVFAFDPNLSVGQNVLSVISRFTWELPQTIAGLAYNLFHNVAGQVEWVKYKYGATVVKSNWQAGGVTLGSYITGDGSIEADANNSLFQHEYGHVLQSRAFGPAYLARVGIPSAFDNKSYGRHAFHPVEADANRRAFLYFNRKLKDEGFQDDEYLDDNKGWNFAVNRFPKGIGTDNTVLDEYGLITGNYVDYQNSSHVFSLNQLIVRSKWYDYLDPFTLNGIGAYNAYQYNKNGTK